MVLQKRGYATRKCQILKIFLFFYRNLNFYRNLPSRIWDFEFNSKNRSWEASLHTLLRPIFFQHKSYDPRKIKLFWIFSITAIPNLIFWVQSKIQFASTVFGLFSITNLSHLLLYFLSETTVLFCIASGAIQSKHIASVFNSKIS